MFRKIAINTKNTNSFASRKDSKLKKREFISKSVNNTSKIIMQTMYLLCYFALLVPTIVISHNIYYVYNIKQQQK